MGILLRSDAYRNIPDECTQLFDLEQSTVEKLRKLSDSRDEVHAGQTSDMYDEAAKGVTMRGRVVAATEDEGHASVHFAPRSTQRRRQLGARQSWACYK